MRTLKLSWLFALAGAIVIPACGDSKSSLNPTAPSAISSGTVNVESGLVVDAGESDTTAKGKDGDQDKDSENSSSASGHGSGSGNSGGGNGNSGGGNSGGGNSGGGNSGGGNSGGGNGNGGGNSGPGNGNGGGNSGPGNGNPTPPTNPGPTAPAPPVQTRVEIEGLITAVGVASISVNGQVVLVTADTEIRHGSRHFVLSDLRVGDRVHVKATRITSTGPDATTIRANEIKLQNRDDDDDDDDDDNDDDNDDDDDEDEDEDDDRAVTVTATDALASETGSNTGTFRLHRDRSNPLVQLPLTVTFTLNGTATNGTDYITVPLTKTFPAGEDSVDVVITPIVDALVEEPETIVLTLTGVTPFQLGTPVTAVIVLNDGTSR